MKKSKYEIPCDNALSLFAFDSTEIDNLRKNKKNKSLRSGDLFEYIVALELACCMNAVLCTTNKYYRTKKVYDSTPLQERLDIAKTAHNAIQEIIKGEPRFFTPNNVIQIELKNQSTKNQSTIDKGDVSDITVRGCTGERNISLKNNSTSMKSFRVTPETRNFMYKNANGILLPTTSPILIGSPLVVLSPILGDRWSKQTCDIFRPQIYKLIN